MENTEPLNIPKGAKRTPEKRSRFFSALPLYASRFTLYALRVTRHAPLRRGYSLMEMLLVVAIIGILFTIGGPVLNQANKNFILSRTRLELQTEARGIMYLLTRNLRQAQSSTVVTGRLDNNQAFYSKISFTTASGKSFVFYQKGTSLMMTEGTLNKEQTKNLKYLAFTFPESNDMGIISVSMTLEKAIYEGRTKALHVASEKVRVMN